MAKHPAHASAAQPKRKAPFLAGCAAGLLAIMLALAAVVHIGTDAPPEGGEKGRAGSEAAFSDGGSLAVFDDAPASAAGEGASDAETGEGGAKGAEAAEPTIEERLAALPAHALVAADLDALDGAVAPFAFTCAPTGAEADGTDDAGGTAPVLSAEAEEALAAALAPFASDGYTAGMLLIDRESGRGIAADLDARAYGASSIKAPYALFLCETQLETGAAEYETLCDEGAAAAFMDGDYLTDGIASYPLGSLIEDSILNSSNDAFRILRAAYRDDAFAAWLEGAGVDPSLAYGEWFPRASARDMGKLWLHAASYLESGTETAAWLNGLLSSTEVSYLRDALAGEDATVRDKAGWIASADAAYNGLCDAGLVSKGGRTYLFCLMTSAPNSAENVENLKALAKAVWNAREDLA